MSEVKDREEEKKIGGCGSQPANQESVGERIAKRGGGGRNEEKVRLDAAGPIFSFACSCLCVSSPAQPSD